MSLSGMQTYYFLPPIYHVPNPLLTLCKKNNELMMRMLRNFFVIHGMHVYAFHCDDELKLMNCKLNLYSEFIIYNVFN